VVIPLYSMPRAGSSDSAVRNKRGDFLGVVYLDSRRPAAFSKLDRRILDALAVEAASILDNARLVERERERERMEQQIGIARDIQQALLPRDFREFPHLGVTGINLPCLTVGGDYFDVFPMGADRTAFIIADVSGKGLGAALLTTMLQGALSGMRIGIEPAQVFNNINHFLCEHAEVARYATMFLGILDRDGQMEFINAGHPSPFLLRRGEIDESFSEGSYPVGLMPGVNYSVARVKIRPGIRSSCSVTGSRRLWTRMTTCTAVLAFAKLLPICTKHPWVTCRRRSLIPLKPLRAAPPKLTTSRSFSSGIALPRRPSPPI
jgi:sigma-B regulation protein RsbU (phosphoserine phosphatase)